MKYASLILLALILLTAGCTQETPTDDKPQTPQLEIAENWARAAPTYAYDGESLNLIEYYIQESDPVNHVITFEFTSRHAGYGDRTNQTTIQVLTNHVITITVINNEVTSATIDGRWDEIAQEPINQETQPEAQTTLQFQPMQCETYPWDEWYANGEINYIQQPTAQQLAQDYYTNEYGINIQVTREEFEQGIAVCQACSICPQTYWLQAEVQEASEARILEADGWQQ